MTRQNVTDGVREIMTKACPTCDGEGVVKSEETIAIEVERRLRQIVKEAGDSAPEAYLVRLNPKVTAQFVGENARALHELESDTGRWFHFQGSDGLPLDHFAITLEGSRDEILEAAVPFRDGDEVHVQIVEPHMYNVDDAVAKIDGYIIEVVNGIPFVGEKKLVRIEQAGRTAAKAVLLGDDAEAAAEAAKEREKAAKARARRQSSTRARPSKPAEVVAVVVAEPDDEETGPPEDASAEAAPKASTGPAAAEDTREDGEGLLRGDEGEVPESEDDDGTLESKPRRRGRRGGRRRSRAKASADATEAPEVSE
jgi:ribonuclease G